MIDPTKIFPFCVGFRITSRLIAAGLLFIAFAAVDLFGQTSDALHRDFDDGHFERVVERVTAGRPSPASRLLAIRSLIHLERYGEADRMLTAELNDAATGAGSSAEHLADLHMARSALARFRRDFPAALEHADAARSAAPASRRIGIEHPYSIGRILYSFGYDMAAIVWLEKAEKLADARSDLGIRLDTYRHLSLAWSSRFNYAKAIGYAERLIRGSERTRYTYKHRTGLFDLANILNACGQRRKAKHLLEKALSLSTAAGDKYQSRIFSSTLLTNALYSGDVGAATELLSTLEKIDTDERFSIETTLGRAVIAAFKGDKSGSDRYFERLQKLPGYSDHFVPYWKSTIAEKNKDWRGMLEQNEVLRSLSEGQNFREDLPGIYLNLAKAHLGLGDREKARESAMRSVALVDESQRTDNAPLSLALGETYHSAYRLLAELDLSEPERSFGIADGLKARVLKDRIDDSALRSRPDPGIDVRKRVEELSVRLTQGADVRGELAGLEKSAALPPAIQLFETELDSESAADIGALRGTAIVSYFFTLGGELLAYVIEGGRPARVVKLRVSETEVDNLTRSIGTKIRDRVFFKGDGKVIYDRLLGPLSLGPHEHIVIVPDKSLWWVPFHALSPDGRSYLIEHRTVSYSPSVSILLDQIKERAPIRKSIRVFANDSFDGRHLVHANREAGKVARVFASRPVTGATRGRFLASAGSADILHFSMHAQADAEDPLASFLAFKPAGGDSGRVTVEDLLGVQLKKRNLAFLASCETTNVLAGEGAVSIAWALFAAGSSSVISAQWEANDRSTEILTEEFYKGYREGKSTAKALQAASVAMIRNKSSDVHEPYFWAAFSLIGDHR